MRKINLMNEASRNAEVVIESVRKPKGISTGLPGGKKVSFKRYVAATEGSLHSKLVAQHGDALAKALIAGDPEIDRELVGRQNKKGFVVEPRRWKVEQTFGCLQRYRRLLVEHEGSIGRSRTMTLLASLFMTSARFERQISP